MHVTVTRFDFGHVFVSQILGLMLVRKLLDLVFSQHDLAWLDDLLPGKEEKEKKKKRKDGGKKEKKKVRGGEESEDEVSLKFFEYLGINVLAELFVYLPLSVCNGASHYSYYVLLVLPVSLHFVENTHTPHQYLLCTVAVPYWPETLVTYTETQN